MSHKITRQTFDEVMMPVYTPFDMLIKRGKGSYLYDDKGNKYIDFTSGIAVNCLGHCNKEVLDIINEQSKQLIHVSNLFTNDKTLSLAKCLIDNTDFDKVFFVNSGTEANEAALKLARRYAHDVYGDFKNEIISFNQSFHGRTFFSVCVGGQDKYSDGFGPKPQAITHIPFNDIKTFEKSISDKTCAVILEVVQGEGGIIKANDDFLLKVRSLCTKHNALLIFDEVQTGIGRTGKLYAYQTTPVIPDIITSAKGLASGLPIGAVLAKDDVASHFSKGTHGSTFGGSALACAVGEYIVNKVSNKNFLRAIKMRHDLFVETLNAIAKRTGKISDIRAYGLLIGINVKDSLKPKVPNLIKTCASHGLLLLSAGHNTIRIAPALNIKTHTILDGLAILEKELNAV